MDEQHLYRLIGERLRTRRMAMGLTQEDLAARAGIRRTSITNIESGRQKLPIHLLYQLCAILGVEIGAVLPTQAEIGVRLTQPIDVAGVTREVPPQVAEIVRQWREE
jgi:transcriptional regulator with XRE-family HTH domain